MKRNWSIKITVYSGREEIEHILKKPAFLPRRGDFISFHLPTKREIKCRVDCVIHDFKKKAVLIEALGAPRAEAVHLLEQSHA